LGQRCGLLIKEENSVGRKKREEDLETKKIVCAGGLLADAFGVLAGDGGCSL
jgi:hypothetical protein